MVLLSRDAASHLETWVYMRIMELCTNAIKLVEAIHFMV